MPPKNCARCQKIVYPTEELKCLDQTWHKLCFKCEECGMSLNVKTFKAHEKRPYCPAHCPKFKATFVADTPEARRLAENSKIQSQVQYHQDFERSKGQYYHLGLDDPELQRTMKVASNISDVKYHEDFEKQKGTRTAVADDPELQRIRQNTAIQSGVAYKGIQRQRDEMETRRPTEREIDDVDEISQQLAHSRIMGPPQPIQIYNNHSNGHNGYHVNGGSDSSNGYSNGYHSPYSPPDSISPPNDRNGTNNYQPKQTPIYSHEDASWVPDHLRGSLSPTENFTGDYYPPSFPRRNFRSVIQSFDNGGIGYNTDMYYQETRYDQPEPSTAFSQQRMPTKVGSIADYDPVNNQWGSIASGPQQHQQSYQLSPAHYESHAQPQMVSPGAQQQHRPSQNQGHHIDLSELKDAVGEIEQFEPEESPAPFKEEYQKQQILPDFENEEQPEGEGGKYRAMYDYDAQEEDEASFYMDDIITNVKRIDEGWVVGTVLRTGRTGMVPANYIEMAS